MTYKLPPASDVASIRGQQCLLCAIVDQSAIVAPYVFDGVSLCGQHVLDVLHREHTIYLYTDNRLAVKATIDHCLALSQPMIVDDPRKPE